jgi:hypothetical protein
MTHNRDGPALGFTRVKNSTCGDPAEGQTFRNSAPKVVLRIYYITGNKVSVWESNTQTKRDYPKLKMMDELLNRIVIHRQEVRKYIFTSV